MKLNSKLVMAGLLLFAVLAFGSAFLAAPAQVEAQQIEGDAAREFLA